MDGAEVRLTGVAKGAAMIGPNMATMLAFVFTDAAVSSADLAALVGRAADQSFNCVSVEGHTSTNDTLLLFANGRAGGGRFKARRWADSATRRRRCAANWPGPSPPTPRARRI